MRLDRKLAGICALLALSACNMDATSPVGTRNAPSYHHASSWGQYELISGDHWNNLEISHSQVIGRHGGRLALGLHELVVPEGAVTKATVFRMSKKPGPHVVVDLDARDQKTGEAVSSFVRPVELRLSYRFAHLTGADLNRMVILWLKDGTESGELVPVPTEIDRRTKHIVGSLMHFSRYAMGMN